MIGIQHSVFRSLDLSALPNCALWLDASDASTITHSSGRVSQINDKSGNARHFTQGTSTKQPKINATTQNGMNVLDFDGVDDELSIGSNGLGRNVGGLTLHVLARVRTPFYGGTNAVIIHVRNNSTLTRANISIGTTAYRLQLGGRRSDGDSFASLTDVAAYPVGFALYSAVFDYANSDAYFYINGVLTASTTSFQTSGNTSNTNSTLAVIGADPGVNFLDGQIGEAAIFHEAQSANAISNIAACLLKKWGIPETLGHITWQTPVDIGSGTTCLDTPSGQVVEYGWRFTSVSGTVAGITFVESSCENESGEGTSYPAYTNSDATFQALMNSAEYKTNSAGHPNNHLRFRLTGLTKGTRYAVQLLIVDKRPGFGNRRQRFLDGYGNESAEITQNSEKYVIGEFVASGPTQLIMARWTGAETDAAVINLLVLRRFT